MKYILLLTSLIIITPVSEAMQQIKHKNNAEKKKAKYFKICHKAIKKNDTQTLHHYIHYKLDINSTDNNGKSLFYYACEIQPDHITTKPYSIQALLYDQKLDVNARDAHQNTPLHIACQLGLSTIVERISKQTPETINAKNHYQKTPLDIAQTQYNATYNEDKNTPHDKAQAQKYALCALFINNAQESLAHKKDTKNNSNQNIISYPITYYPYQEKIIRLLKKYGAHFNVENDKRIYLRHICLNIGPKYISQQEAVDLCTSPLKIMDLYFIEYNKIFNNYLDHKKSPSSFYQQYSSIEYEQLLQYKPLIQTLLHIAAQSTKLFLLKFILKTAGLTKDIRLFIMLIYYHSNIHRMIATIHLLNQTNSYNNDNDINHTDLHTKLIKKPQPELLWNIEFRQQLPQKSKHTKWEI